SLDITTASAFTLTSHGTFSTLGRGFTNTDTTDTDLPLTPSTPHTPPPWLTVARDRTDASVQSETEAVTEELLTELSALTRGTDQPQLVNLSPSQPRRSTRAVATDSTQQQTNPPTRPATTIGIE
ncbi:hypothetical protein M9458_035820, partial [Cirrhinus mrigala]